MITSKDFDVAGFLRDLKAAGLEEKLTDLDTLVRLADNHNRWTEEFRDAAASRAKKAMLRKFLRDGFQDEEGVNHEFLYVEETDRKTNTPVGGYKQLEFFSRDNFVWAIDDCMKRIRGEQRKLDRLMRRLREKHGKQGVAWVQAHFEFPLPDTDSDE